MFQHIFDEAIVIALCPQEFLKIQREHLIIRFVADAVAFDFPVVDAQHGAAADHIESAIDFKELQCCSNIRELLQFIKKYQGFTFDKPFGRVHSGNVLDDVLCLVSICCDHLILRLFYKIDTDHTFVVHLSKPFD